MSETEQINQLFMQQITRMTKETPIMRKWIE